MSEKILRDSAAEERYNDLKQRGYILGEFIVGSTAYGTNLPTSDIDKKFVYIEPLENLLTGTHTEQLEITKDYTGFEIGRFMELLHSANPGILDLTQPAENCIISVNQVYRQHIMTNAEKFLTKRVRYSYGKYAADQIKRAKGDNKKFMQPMEKERKGILDFCWVTEGQGSKPLKAWLKHHTIIPEMCGCVRINHMKNCYLLFVDDDMHYEFAIKNNPLTSFFAKDRQPKYKGIVDKDNVQIKLSSVEKGVSPEVMFYANVEAFSVYCKKYKEYWDFMETYNADRYVIDEDGGYNAKNVGHCHRLLDMAIEILRDKKLNIMRENREELIAIRLGQRKYDDLVNEAEAKSQLIVSLYETSDLPEELPPGYTEDLLLKIRNDFYNLNCVQSRGKSVVYY